MAALHGPLPARHAPPIAPSTQERVRVSKWAPPPPPPPPEAICKDTTHCGHMIRSGEATPQRNESDAEQRGKDVGLRLPATRCRSWRRRRSIIKQIARDHVFQHSAQRSAHPPSLSLKMEGERPLFTHGAKRRRGGGKRCRCDTDGDSATMTTEGSILHSIVWLSSPLGCCKDLRRRGRGKGFFGLPPHSSALRIDVRSAHVAENPSGDR